MINLFRRSQKAYFSSSILDLKNAYSFVETQVRKYDWPSFIISKHMPNKIRNDYLTLCWFYSELSRIEESTTQKSLGLGKLDFWAESIDSVFNDKPVQEPMTICLHSACKQNPLPKFLFQKMINSRRTIVEKNGFSSLNEMALACEANRAPLIALILKLLRIPYEQDEHLRKSIELVSRAIGIIDYTKRVPFTLRKYKLFLPSDLQIKYGVNIKNLWNRIEGKPKEELYDLILEVTAFARQSLKEVSSLQTQLPPQSFRAFLHASETEYYLEQLEHYNFYLFEKALNSNSFVQLPIRVYQNCRKGKFLSNL